jgi:phosphatidate cytidylyltransferase
VTSAGRASDLGTRLIVAIALVGLAAVALLSGGPGFWLVMAVVGMLMASEWGALALVPDRQRRLGMYAVGVPLAAMCPWAAGPGFLALGLVGGAAIFLVAVTRNVQLAIGAFYVGLPVLALLLLREHEHGLLLTFWTMALVWACDTGAYFTGRFIGGPKLAPAISPSKTWSGLVGGVGTALLAALLLRALFNLPVELVIATPVLAVLSQLGDLYESSLKRRAGFKDSGTLLPGHGGFMDRLDGLVPVAPVAALIVLLTL